LTYDFEDSKKNDAQSLAWNWEGTQIATTCKEKKVRIFDARTGSALQVCFSSCGYSTDALKGGRS
jgi:WD40 repeat protein